jgi:hypothetical protein
MLRSMLRWHHITDRIHSTSGKTLDGNILSPEHRSAFAKALRLHFAPPVERSATPPPDPPEPSLALDAISAGEAYFDCKYFSEHSGTNTDEIHHITASAIPGYPWVYDIHDLLAKHSIEKPYGNAVSQFVVLALVLTICRWSRCLVAR